MPQKRPPVNKEYSAKLKAIRGYVDFDYDLRKPLHPNSKRKIDRYFDAINKISARPNKVYRSKNKKRVQEVQAYGRNGFENLPQIKVAFYESSAANPVKIKFDKTGLHAKGQYFDIRYVQFDRAALVKNPEKEISRALEQPGAKGARWHRIAVGADGQFSIANAYEKTLVKGQILSLMSKYEKDTPAAGPGNNHYWANWLDGLLPMTAKNQKTVRQYLAADEKARDALKTTRARKKRNAKNKRVRQRNRSI